MICPNCGTENEKELTICQHCGEELVQSSRNFGKDFAWASLALGIWSLFFYPYLYAPLTVIAAVLARRQDYRGKMPIIGMAFGLVALIGWAVFRILS